jgi:hypothetical protein
MLIATCGSTTKKNGEQSAETKGSKNIFIIYIACDI